MDYRKHYNLLIEKARNREVPKGYTERHHIVPRCIGGYDSIDNIVVLTPEEHYTAHLMLAKIYPHVTGLLYACAVMCSSLGGRKNKLYGWVRRKFVKQTSMSIKNRWARKKGFDDYNDQCIHLWNMYICNKESVKSIYEKLGIALNQIRQSVNFHARETNQEDVVKKRRYEERSEISKAARRNIRPEQEARRIEAMRNSPKVKENGKRLSQIRKGKGNPAYGKRWTHPREECPHCGKVVGGKRWHFDNCKEKK